MTLQVLELNDHALVLGDAEGAQLVSPGFVLADEKELIFGESAQAQSRLHPNQSHSRYWQDLSLEPLAKGRLPNPRWRHLADLAHGHLDAIAQESGGEQTSTLLSVPGSFSQQQLGIVLGIAKQTPLQVISLVDSALLAGAALATPKNSIVMQQQLHQTLFSLLELNGSQLRVVETLAVPSTGSAQVLDSLMHLSTELFIEQCRFNPQHDAATEQLLYNAVPQWLSSQPNSSTLQLDLNADGTAYTAKLTSDSLITALTPIRSRLLEQLAALRQRAPTAEVIVCPNLDALPGLRAQLETQGTVSTVGVNDSLKAALQYQAQLTDGEGLSLHRALTVEQLEVASPPQSKAKVKAKETLATVTLSADGGAAALLLDQLQLDGQSLEPATPGKVSLDLAEGERLVLRASDGSELSVDLSKQSSTELQRDGDGEE